MNNLSFNFLAETNPSEFWPMIATGASILATIIWTLALFIMSDFRATLKKHGQDIEGIKDRLSICRRECDDSHTSKDDWVREVGYSRRLGEQQIAAMAKIEARIDIADKLPEISAAIARAITIEMKRGE